MKANNILHFSQLRSLMSVAILVGLTSSAMAQVSRPEAAAAPVRASTPMAAMAAQGPQLTIGQVYELMDGAGLREIREIEWSDGRYEVKARNAQGTQVKLEVDGSTGTVLRTRVKH